VYRRPSSARRSARRRRRGGRDAAGGDARRVGRRRQRRQRCGGDADRGSGRARPARRRFPPAPARPCLARGVGAAPLSDLTRLRTLTGFAPRSLETACARRSRGTGRGARHERAAHPTRCRTSPQRVALSQGVSGHQLGVVSRPSWIVQRETAGPVGAAHAVAGVTGTARWHVALLTAGCGRRRVLVPTLTFIATANAVCYCGRCRSSSTSRASTWGLDPARSKTFSPRNRRARRRRDQPRDRRTVRAMLPGPSLLAIPWISTPSSTSPRGGQWPCGGLRGNRSCSLPRAARGVAGSSAACRSTATSRHRRRGGMSSPTTRRWPSAPARFTTTRAPTRRSGSTRGRLQLPAHEPPGASASPSSSSSAPSSRQGRAADAYAPRWRRSRAWSRSSSSVARLDVLDVLRAARPAALRPRARSSWRRTRTDRLPARCGIRCTPAGFATGRPTASKSPTTSRARRLAAGVVGISDAERGARHRSARALPRPR